MPCKARQKIGIIYKLDKYPSIVRNEREIRSKYIMQSKSGIRPAAIRSDHVAKRSDTSGSQYRFMSPLVSLDEGKNTFVDFPSHFPQCRICCCFFSLRGHGALHKFMENSICRLDYTRQIAFLIAQKGWNEFETVVRVHEDWLKWPSFDTSALQI